MAPKSYGRKMEPVPREEWPFFTEFETQPLKVWRSKDYLAVLYLQKADGKTRLTVNSVRRMPNRKRRNGTDWRDGITWDELQRIKNETLGPDVWCVEVYPSESKLVNVSNMRHLWPLEEPPETRFPDHAVTKDSDIQAVIDILKGALK